MSIKVGINGFGRIGRLAFRRCVEEGMEVVAINDLSDADNLAYLLKYDSGHGTFRKDDISFKENALVFAGREIPIYAKRNPAEIPWSDHGVDVVLECTGIFKDTESAGVHITNGGAKGVVISAPAKKTPTYVYGVNCDKLTADQKVISGASCTTNCLAPMCKVLDDNFGIIGGYMTTVHAYTNDQATLDIIKKKDFRRGRAAAMNIVPTTTGAAKAIGLVMPKLNGRLQGGAIRVPVLDGSLVELNVRLSKKVTKDEIDAAMKKASEGELKDILGYTDEKIVSRDILGLTAGSLYDAVNTNVFEDEDGNQYVTVFGWYDNEYSYTCQLIRLAKKFAGLLGA
ncbi:MAG: type I glyceraldehyde-3-phosphate dehydrogenase [Bacilli bacterium]